MKLSFKTTKAKVLIGLASLIIIASALIWGQSFIAFAQSVIDSFNDQTKIADTWRISTSTLGQIQIAAKDCNILTWFCLASTTCPNYLDDGAYIIVAQDDATTTRKWKTVNTDCGQPQCGNNGGQDNFKADNTLSFASYPARDYCKSIGGRLPTIDELECIYNNRASFGSFVSGDYWSSTEYSATNAWYYRFSLGTPYYTFYKSSDYYVRCVLGW
jgi:hypothetical protein